MTDRPSRRTFLAGAGSAGLIGALPASARSKLLAESPAAAGTDGHFLNAHELGTLAALLDSLIPGPPADHDPGAVDAGAHVYVDLLLAGFDLEMPRIFSAGPFSDRNGSDVNYFSEFLELDPLDELVWRTRIEGSQGIPAREWNGPVRGWRETYREGLARLDSTARHWLGKEYTRSPRWLRDFLALFPAQGLRDFVDLAFEHGVEGTYGNPEYGGNQGLVGWTYTGWPGDSQPAGYADVEVSARDA